MKAPHIPKRVATAKLLRVYFSAEKTRFLPYFSWKVFLEVGVCAKIAFPGMLGHGIHVLLVDSSFYLVR